MVGTDDNGVARIGATVKATNVPFGSTVQVRIAYRDPSTENIVPIGNMDSYSDETALLSADIYNSGPGYFVVAWIDDGSGYNPTSSIQDDTSNRWTIYFVALNDYTADVAQLTIAKDIGGWLHIYPWASRFLSAFLYNTPIPTVDNHFIGTVSDTEPLLYQNTGVVWLNGSPPYGDIVINQFYAPDSSSNNLAATILANSDFINQCIMPALTLAKPRVQGYDWAGDPHSQHTFKNIPMTAGGTGIFQFTTGDLFFAIGQAQIKNCFLSATVRKSDLQLIRLDITNGTLYDYYDFDVNRVDGHNFNKDGAEVQAGYNPAETLTPGHVFYTEVTLNQTNLPIPFNFSS